DDLLAVAEGREKDVLGTPVGRVGHLVRWARARALPLAAGVLLALGVGFEGVHWWTHRSATLSLSSIPDGAEVLVAGTSRGATPLRLELSPGAYDVVVRTEGFEDLARRVELSAGAERD